MSPVDPPKGSWFEQAEQAVEQIEKAHIEGASIEPAGVALAFLRGSLAVAEALGGVQNSLDEVDGQLNTMGGSLAENTAGLVLATEGVKGELDWLRKDLTREISDGVARLAG